MSRHLLAREERTRKTSNRSRPRNAAALDRLDREVIPALQAQARELADELWEIAEDEPWVHLVVAQRVAGWEPDPEFGDLASLRMRLVLHCVADDLAMYAPDRRRKG
jgi:hypothetical protein